MERVVGGALALTAAMVNKVAALVVPAREVDVFPHRLWAKGRNWRHHDAWTETAHGWTNMTIEFGGWALQASWRTREEVATWAA